MIDPNFYEKSEIKIFLSYSTSDKKDAGVIKSRLEDFGFKVFLAHHDINPSEEWIHQILDNLKKCDIFIPYLTANSMDSFWVNQEIGIGFSRQDLIIFPLKVELNPWGFIAGKQAFQIKNNSVFELNTSIEYASEKLLKIILEKTPERIKNSIILSLKKSPNFNSSNIMGRILINFDNFSIEEMNKIIEYFFENRQVRDAVDMRPLIRKFYEENIDQIDGKLLESLDDYAKKWDFSKERNMISQKDQEVERIKSSFKYELEAIYQELMEIPENFDSYISFMSHHNIPYYTENGLFIKLRVEMNLLQPEIIRKLLIVYPKIQLIEEFRSQCVERNKKRTLTISIHPKEIQTTINEVKLLIKEILPLLEPGN